jgi:hypothetical protein
LAAQQTSKLNSPVEGELKKRISDWAKDPFEAVSMNEVEVTVNELLNEAKQDHPCGKCPCHPSRGGDKDNCLNYCSGAWKQHFKWFEKWFGEQSE